MSKALMKLPCYCGTIRQAARGITVIYDEKLAPHGIKVTQFTLLIAIKRLGQPSTGDLARMLLMDSTTLSRTLATLKKSLLIDVMSGTDLRMRLWYLTDQGRKLLRSCEKDWVKAQAKVIDIFGEELIGELDQKIFDLSAKMAADGVSL